ncbi:hypothetical protein BJ973_008926 [Actinoplanes tereljensis]|uniref:Uncharacterized protein n=1 Tax=Paractinoplanes tereljensis TaxID=571912 RepID=A0A919TQF8_9ACTN|nr:hypothetical protein Ate02nite_08390 [Actinoplanes tereljensis]
MRRSAYRRAAAPSGGNRRLLAVGAVVAALGAVVAFTTLSSAAENDVPAGSGAGKVVNGQVILTDTCVDSKLLAHDGFQKGDRCVSTEFGEVSSAANNSSLLITESPRTVNVNTPFTLKVSTRNLIRDRFLAAGAGGYYVESSVLQNGIERGHFHTACRMLTSTREAPDPSPVPAFFVATEDKKGGKAPDTVTISVPGLPQEGTAQCASWAGDGSHRVPMMERANETPAIDAIRIRVTANGGGQQGGNNGGQQGGNNGGQQGGNNNGGQNNGGQQGGNNGGQQGGNNTNTTVTPATPPTTAPTTKATTKAPTNGGTTGATVKDDFTPNPTPTTTVKPAATTTTTKPTDTKTAKPTSTRTTESSETDATESESDSEAEPTETVTAKPKASKSTEAAAAGDYTYSNDDGQLNSGEQPPTIDQVAAKTTQEQKSGVLALTGSNTVAFLGGAVVLMLVGLTVMALTRRRRPGTTWQ